MKYIHLCSLFALAILIFTSPNVLAETVQSGGSFTSCADVAASTAIPKIECDALLAFETANFATMQLWSWKTSNNPCEWFGITCADGQITQMNYSLNGLNGTLPPQIGNLSSLEQLEIRRNGLTGSIPASIGNLDNLWLLNLERNEMTGAIPSSIGNMDSLSSLSLNENNLSGSLPSSLGSISTLVAFRAYGNQLTGELPAALGNLADLEIVRLQENNLSGVLPPELGSAQKLRWLQVDSNPEMTGTIPDEFAALTAMTDFRFHATTICIEDGSVAQTWLATTVGTTQPLCEAPTAIEMSNSAPAASLNKRTLVVLLALIITLLTTVSVRRQLEQ